MSRSLLSFPKSSNVYNTLTLQTPWLLTFLITKGFLCSLGPIIFARHVGFRQKNTNIAFGEKNNLHERVYISQVSIQQNASVLCHILFLSPIFSISAKCRNHFVIFWLFKILQHFHSGFSISKLKIHVKNRWMETHSEAWLPACRWLWDSMMMAREEDFVCVCSHE